MTFLKFGDVVINPERIVYISSKMAVKVDAATRGFDEPEVLGVTLYFEGGASVEIKQAGALECFLRWAEENGHLVQSV